MSFYFGSSAREAFATERWMSHAMIWRATRLFCKTPRHAMPLMLPTMKDSRRPNGEDATAAQRPANCERRAA